MPSKQTGALTGETTPHFRLDIERVNSFRKEVLSLHYSSHFERVCHAEKKSGSNKSCPLPLWKNGGKTERYNQNLTGYMQTFIHAAVKKLS